jgi:hypothetical protein
MRHSALKAHLRVADTLLHSRCLAQLRHRKTKRHGSGGRRTKNSALQHAIGVCRSRTRGAHIKQAIFGLNSARLYRLNLKAADASPMPPYSADRLAQLKKEYEFAAKEPSNLRYGYVRAG